MKFFLAMTIIFSSISFASSEVTFTCTTNKGGILLVSPFANKLVAYVDAKIYNYEIYNPAIEYRDGSSGKGYYLYFSPNQDHPQFELWNESSLDTPYIRFNDLTFSGGDYEPSLEGLPIGSRVTCKNTTNFDLD